MKIYDQLINESEIAILKDFFKNHQDKKYANWAVNDNIIDNRITINPNSAEFDIVRKIVSIKFNNPKLVWAAYQRANGSHNTHIDPGDDGNHIENYRYTIIVAMDTNPDFKTLIWCEKFSSVDEWVSYIHQWGENRQLINKTSVISQLEALDHTFDANQNDYIVDYLTLDGVFTYTSGSGVLFDARQVHCTNDWRKFGYTHRDLLTIHIINETEIII
jgi:hypothetical protein